MAFRPPGSEAPLAPASNQQPAQPVEEPLPTGPTYFMLGEGQGASFVTRLPMSNGIQQRYAFKQGVAELVSEPAHVERIRLMPELVEVDVQGRPLRYPKRIPQVIDLSSMTVRPARRRDPDPQEPIPSREPERRRPSVQNRIEQEKLEREVRLRNPEQFPPEPSVPHVPPPEPKITAAEAASRARSQQFAQSQPTYYSCPHDCGVSGLKSIAAVKSHVQQCPKARNANAAAV